MYRYIQRYLFCWLLLSLPFCAEAGNYGFTVVDEPFDLLAAQLDQLDQQRRLSSEHLPLVEQLTQRAEELSNPILRSRAIIWTVRCQQLELAADSCMTLLEQARAWTDAEHYPYDHAFVAYLMAGYNERLNRLYQAYLLLKDEVIPYFESIADSYRLLCAYHLMSYISRDIGDQDEALRYLNLAQQQNQRSGGYQGRIDFAHALMQTDSDSMAFYLNRAIQSDPDDVGIVAQAYMNLSNLVLERMVSTLPADEMRVLGDSALQLIDLGLKAVTEHGGQPMLEAMLLTNRAAAFHNLQQEDEALATCEQIERLSSDFQKESNALNIYRLKWYIYARKGDIKRAYQNLRLYQNAFEARTAQSRSTEIQRQQIREELHRQQEAMNQLRQEGELQKRAFFITLLILLVILLIIAVLAVIFYQQKRIRKIQNQELRNSLRQEVLIKNMQQQNFERDLKQKNCELSSSVLLLANKNEVLQQLSQITRQYSERGEIPVEYVKQLNQVIGESLKKDDEWDRFKIHFDQVHPGFFTTLKKRYPDLSENELKLCAYIRIGLRAKQIAEMLNVTADSVNTNRYRLRKKLQLEKNTNLDDFIRNL